MFKENQKGELEYQPLTSRTEEIVTKEELKRLLAEEKQSGIRRIRYLKNLDGTALVIRGGLIE